MLCSQCGTDIPARAQTCPSCGSAPPPVDSLEPQTIPSVSADDPETQARVPSSGPPSPGAGTLIPGQTFGTRYRIIRELGRGGMGVVYQAWDDELGEAVALKVVRTDGASGGVSLEQERRFKRELVLARQVTHRHVVRIHDLGDVGGVKYFTMPFIHGETLSACLRREERLPVSRALRYIRQVVAGLAAAHQAGIVHRDLKPGNIMLDADDQAVILDFGLARTESSAALTADGVVMGTPQYMAPEQAMGGDIDQRTDIYAVGLILYEMLSGQHRSAQSALSILMRRLKEPPPSIRGVVADAPEAVDQLLARCLQVDPAARYQTSSALAEALNALDDDGYARSTPAPAALPAVRQPRRLLFGLALVGLVAITAGSAWWLLGRTPAGPAAAAPTPLSVLIADFDNRTGDPNFSGSLELALGIAMEGAPFITAYPHTDAEKVLASLTPGAKLDEAGARVVARREGIKVVLSGTVAVKDSRYTIAVRAIDPSGEKPATTVNAGPLDKKDVLGAVGTLASRLRASLGDTATAAALQAAAETFTAASIEAMREYSLGQDLLLARKDLNAIAHFRRATEIDPQLGRAYAGWAVAAYTIGQKAEASTRWEQALKLTDRMTDRERYRTLGSYFLLVTRDYPKAIESLKELVTRYPADTAGLNNLAYAYFQTLDFPKACEEGRKALALWPKSARFLSNSSLYAMYASDFAEAARQSTTLIAIDPNSYIAYLPLAVAQAATGDLAAARQTYQRMAATDETGRSTAALGLADLAIYEGRTAEARDLLVRGIADDERTKNTAGVAAKYAALVDATLQDGDARAARTAADALVAQSMSEETLVPSAAVDIVTGTGAAARRYAAVLGERIPPRSRAYGKLIDARILLKAGHRAEALDALRESLKLADLWLTRYWLGIAYVENGDGVAAESEFRTCQGKRRGEGTAVFLDDQPTVRYLAPLEYWLGRAREPVNPSAAAAQFRTFLTLRSEASMDPLAIDARKRLASR